MNPLVYQCGRPAQIKVKGPVTGKQYDFIKCDPGRHANCPVTMVDDKDAPGLVGHIVADCPKHPCIPSVSPKADHDLVFIRCWEECTKLGKSNLWQGIQVGHKRWFQCLKEERAKLK